MTTNYWNTRRVALLGGANLIGTHLARKLLEMNVKQVWIADNLSSGKKENVPSGVSLYDGDLREYRNVLYAVAAADVVFHLAAQHGGRGYVETHPVELYDNLALDTTIFRACADAKVKKVIFSSSACAYPIHLQDNIKDILFLWEDLVNYNHMEDADGPYGREKLLGEMILDAYVEKGYFLGCSTRSFTVYGPLMNESHAIAALIAKTLIKQDPFEIWGDGNQIRNWTFVDDNVDGALLAAEHLNRGAVNIGIEERLTPWQACQIIWNIMDWRPKHINYQMDSPIGPVNRVADASKLKSLGWSPNHTFEQGLKKTIDWYVSTHEVRRLRKELERKLTER